MKRLFKRHFFLIYGIVGLILSSILYYFSINTYDLIDPEFGGWGSILFLMEGFFVIPFWVVGEIVSSFFSKAIFLNTEIVIGGGICLVILLDYLKNKFFRID